MSIFKHNEEFINDFEHVEYHIDCFSKQVLYTPIIHTKADYLIYAMGIDTKRFKGAELAGYQLLINPLNLKDSIIFYFKEGRDKRLALVIPINNWNFIKQEKICFQFCGDILSEEQFKNLQKSIETKTPVMLPKINKDDAFYLIMFPQETTIPDLPKIVMEKIETHYPYAIAIKYGSCPLWFEILISPIKD